MAIKGSSDELNPPVVTAGTVLTKPRAARSARDYLALAIATCGVGYLPIAPGTWGSLVGVALYLLLQSLILRFIRAFAAPNSVMLVAGWSVFLAAELTLIALVSLAGIWAASRVERLSGRKDPGRVVIDEVAGQLIALLPILPRLDPGWSSILFAFLLFRLFDIIKPYPARRLERLEAGLGIMADDVVAGGYAAVVISIIIAVGVFVT